MRVDASASHTSQIIDGLHAVVVRGLALPVPELQDDVPGDADFAQTGGRAAVGDAAGGVAGAGAGVSILPFQVI